MEMKAKMGKAVINDKNENLVAFAKSIDFTELFDNIRMFINVDCGFYNPVIKTSDERVRITFKSHDFVGQTGPFAAILKRCYVHSDRNGVCNDSGFV